MFVCVIVVVRLLSVGLRKFFEIKTEAVIFLAIKLIVVIGICTILRYLRYSVG